MSRHSQGSQSSHFVVGIAIAVASIVPAICDSQTSAANRIEVQVVADGDSGGQSALVVNEMSHDLMAYRFRVDGAEPATVAGAESPWEVTVLVGSDHASRALRLTTGSSEVTFPRPLGVRVGAGDSLRVILSFPGGPARELTLRLSIEYEPIDRPQSRIAVVAVDARPSAGSTIASNWDWTEEAGGRLLAVAGLPLHHVSLVSLTDVESGATLWSSSRRGDRPIELAPAAATLRLGVPLVAGRTYRLTVTFTVGAHEAPSGHGVVAMILPANDRR